MKIKDLDKRINELKNKKLSGFIESIIINLSEIVTTVTYLTEIADCNYKKLFDLEKEIVKLKKENRKLKDIMKPTEDFL